MTIQQIQNLLQYLGYYTIQVDGLPGPGTTAAVKAFQADNGLDADGIPGQLTQKALVDAVAKGRFKPSDRPQEGQGGAFWSDIKYFTREEFRCKCGGKYCNGFPAEPQEGMVRALDAVRAHFGKAIIPSSGVRCPTHNANVGGVSNSRHLSGKAVDFSVPGLSADMVLSYVQHQNGIRYAYAIDASYVHMDIE